ncbi:MAG TPA: YicC family protein, partial [Candidatus Hydrogenedentes bacterium]|nr:YicC family protein [Candidatus Hydrogenedentota bacterium]
GDLISVEICSVNHRFLDCTFRLPPCWTLLEPVLREVVKQQVERGKVSVYVGRKRGAQTSQTVRFDAETAREYIEASRQLAALMNTTQSISLDVVAQMEGVFYQDEREEDLDRVQAILEHTLGEALRQFNAMREAEGVSLAAELRIRVEAMRASIAEIEARLPELAERYADRLRARMRELNIEIGLPEDRLAVELALLADKADVTEEIVRLRSHLDQTMALFEAGGPIGRELNFLAQEIQREANTLGSKLRDGDVGREVLRVKCELEKLREQAQNLE